MYQEKYPKIAIESISVMPRGYMKSLPKSYKTHMPKKAHLSNKGIINIKTPEHKKLFFDYLIEAKIYVYLSRKNMKRGERVSTLTTTKKGIYLDKLRALPISMEQINTTQLKHHVKQDYIITLRDVEMLNIIKKGSHVNISLKNNNINISFSAKALQNAKLNDIITVQKNNGKRIHVIVTGKNRAEIR